MPYSAIGLLTTALLLFAGCASPFSSGSATRNRAEAPATGQIAATSPATQNPRAADRKLSDDRIAPGEKPVIEQRIAELLAAAASRQQSGRLDVAQYGYEQVLRL